MGRNDITSKKRRTKKTLKLFEKKVVSLKRVCIFAVPIRGSAGVDGLRVREGLRLLKKTLKFSSETFGQLEIKFYFCTRKYGATLTERLLRYKAKDIKIIDIQYNNQVRKN